MQQLLFRFAILVGFVLLLFSCNPNQKQIEGGWIGLKGDVNSLEFMPNGKVFWNGVSPRDYSVSGDKLTVKWLGNEEVFDIKTQGDTLVLENLDKRYAFMPMATYFQMGEQAFASALKKAEKQIGSMYYPYGELQEFKLADLEKEFFLEPKSKKSLNPENPIYYGQVLLPDSTLFGLIAQPILLAGKPELYWQETIESATGRYFRRQFNKTAEKVRFKLPKEEKTPLRGAVSFFDGEELQVEYIPGGTPEAVSTPENIAAVGKLWLNKNTGLWSASSVKIDGEKDAEGMYNATATMANGELLSLRVNYKTAEIVDDGKSPKIALKYRLNAFSGEEVSFSKFQKGEDDKYHFTVNFAPSKMSFSGTLPLKTMLWYPENTKKDLAVAVRIQMGRTLNKTQITNVEIQETRPSEYLAEVFFEDNEGFKSKKSVTIQHLGEGFVWKRTPTKQKLNTPVGKLKVPKRSN